MALFSNFRVWWIEFRKRGFFAQKTPHFFMCKIIIFRKILTLINIFYRWPTFRWFRLWFRTWAIIKTKAQTCPNNFHCRTSRNSGKIFWKNSVSWCLHQRRTSSKVSLNIVLLESYLKKNPTCYSEFFQFTIFGNPQILNNM